MGKVFLPRAMALSHQRLRLQYGLRLDASDEFIQGYADGMRLDQRGQGVACGKGWIPRSKKCSRDKASQTSEEAKAKTVEKAKARAKLKGEVKAAKGQKARVKPKQNPSTPKTDVENRKMSNLTSDVTEGLNAFLKYSRAGQMLRNQVSTTIPADDFVSRLPITVKELKGFVTRNQQELCQMIGCKSIAYQSGSYKASGRGAFGHKAGGDRAAKVKPSVVVEF